MALAGGSAGFPGLKERLEFELAALAPPGLLVRVEAPPGLGRGHQPPGHQSLLHALSAGAIDDAPWITREEYAASGPGIVHMKCA